MTPRLIDMCKWVTENTRDAFLIYCISFRCGPVARNKWITGTTKQLTRSADLAEIAAWFPSIYLTVPVSETHHLAITRISCDYLGDYA
jgi:hypothetical protein